MRWLFICLNFIYLRGYVSAVSAEVLDESLSGSVVSNKAFKTALTDLKSEENDDHLNVDNESNELDKGSRNDGIGPDEIGEVDFGSGDDGSGDDGSGEEGSGEDEQATTTEPIRSLLSQ